MKQSHKFAVVLLHHWASASRLAAYAQPGQMGGGMGPQ